jgi:hypothetical protein
MKQQTQTLAEQLAAVDQAKKLRTHAQRLSAVQDLVTTDGHYTRIHIRTDEDMQRVWDQYGTDIYRTGDQGIILVEYS